MPAAERLLDVWIVDLKKVYTGVPFTVVTDWLQQGRLLAADRVRLAGKEKWHPVENVPALVPYLPKAQPLAAQDRAEALQPIDLGFQSAKVREEEDDDVDMIPLIDVSLVLLIFFMMTAAVASGVFSPIATPTARHQLASISTDMYWIGIEFDKDDKTITRYSLGKDSEKENYLVKPTEGEEVLAGLAKELDQASGDIKVRLRADKNLPIETIKGLTLDLQELEVRLNRTRAVKGRVHIIVLGEVSEPTK
ncbi:MAG: biopolymer transporter ExbD [Planctomycetes bacterium]|nr:biopolymer transporter ExbD [Planctomycetota bacterium]